MALSARDAYLQTQVLTAPPQKLRLMLIEGAMRFVQRTAACWEAEQWEEGLEANIRAREILGELMASLDPEQSPLAGQILPIYNFVFRTLTEAQLEHNRQKLADALRVLGEERETWRQVCEALPGDEERPAMIQKEITVSSLPSAPAGATAPTPRSAPLAFDSDQMQAPPAFPSQATARAASAPSPRGCSFEA
jgi:flagellar protein FliS